MGLAYLGCFLVSEIYVVVLDNSIRYTHLTPPLPFRGAPWEVVGHTSPLAAPVRLVYLPIFPLGANPHQIDLKTPSGIFQVFQVCTINLSFDIVGKKNFKL